MFRGGWCTSGSQKTRGINAQGQLIPVNRAQDPAPATQPSKVYPGQELADITGIPIFAKKRVPLEDLMKLEQEHKFVKKLSSDVWPPKVGGVYFTEPRNYGLPKNYYGTDTPHPVVVMGPADSLKFKDCVLVLDISHNMPLKDEYKTPLRELFPEGTSISGDPGKSDYLTKSFINSAVYRVIQANKFVLVPPVKTELVVMTQDKVERLREERC
ncbi:hypothetical protein F5887DRAFT_273468 [Amanita rubescens]|nr:hypothetical protein F5887DRAFT_273468 [Amanita rubescens]